MTLKASLSAIAITGACVASTASAAVITGAAIGSPTMPANLTTTGDTDWAYWTAAATSVASMAPANKMSGGAGLISSVTNIAGTGGVRGSGTNTGIGFTFSNGTATVTGSDLRVTGVFNESLGTTTGRGVQFAINLPDTQEYKISLWVSGFYSTGRLTAALPGAASYIDSSFQYEGGTKPAKLYELTVQASQANDDLTLSYVLTAGNNSSSHVLFAGVAIDAVPEPAALGILAPLAVIGLRRRSHRP